jgi:hypothetical protein
VKAIDGFSFGTLPTGKCCSKRSNVQPLRFVQTVQLGGSILRHDLLELAASYRLEAAIRRILE